MKTAPFLPLSALLFAALTAAPHPGQGSLRVATWNIKTVGIPGTLGFNSTIDVLQRLQPDIIAINEVNGAVEIPELIQLANMAGYPHVIVAGENPFGGLRNAILSKLPFVSTGFLMSDDLSGDPLANDITRTILTAVVDVPGGGQLTFVCGHWKAGVDDIDEFRRAIESIRTVQTLGGLNSLQDAFVIAGDLSEEIDDVPQSPSPFTSIPPGEPMGFVLGSDLAAELAGPGIVNDPFFYLQDAAQGDARALDAEQLDGNDATAEFSGRRLDYLLVSRNLWSTCPPAEVYDSTDEGLGGGLPKFGTPLGASTSLEASTRYPVFADLTLPAGPVATGSSTPYGCGLNPAGSLTVLSGSPTVGTVIELGVDNPLGTQAAGSLSLLGLSLAPDAAFPCGIPVPGWGMTAGAPGELLLSLSPLDLIDPLMIGPPWAGAGLPAPFPLPLPPNCNLLGLSLFAQGVIVELVGPVGIGLSNGLELQLGP